MSLAELLSELNRRGLEVWADGEQLRLRGPKGAANQELRQALSQRKSELLTLLRERDRAKDESPITPAPRNGPAPLSYGQQRLWILDRLEPGNSTYNLTMPMQVQGRLEPEILERCFVEIVRRHEILRTRYAEHEGSPVQIVDAEPRIGFRVLDEREVLALEPGGIERFLQRAGEQPFDLARGPLVRLLVINRGSTEQFIQLEMHHITADVWARVILIRELVTLYAAYASGQTVTLPPLPLQYADFAVWQRGYVSGDVRKGLVDYWRGKLAGMPPLLEVPGDRVRPLARTDAGGEIRFEIGPALTKALKALSHGVNATPFMGMMAAFFVLLHRLTGREDLVLGANSINRSRKELEPLVGFFVDNLVMRLDLSGNPGFSTVLERVREMVLDALAHQDLPFDVLVEELKPPRSLGYNPLFQVLFAWVRMQDESLDAPGLKVRPLEFETTISRFDLNLFVEDYGERLTARFVFSRDLYDRSTIQHYMDCFQTLLQALVDEPQRPVAELPLLSQADRERVLRQWNDTRRDYPSEQCLHELIDAQASLTPDARAIVMEDRVLTYGELARRSEQLAVHLQELGVGPESVVGVHLDRSPQLLVSLLAVLKAGGAFLALDPDEPLNRMRHMLGDANPRVLIFEESLAGRLSGLGHLTLLEVDEAGEFIPDATGKELRRETGPEHLAYILYTSGSTGQPKGTEITHRSIINYLTWCVEAYRLQDGSGSPVLGSVSFDGTLTSLFAPLLAGRTLFLLPRGHEIDLLASESYAERGLSFIKMTPSHLRAFDGLGRAQRVFERTHAIVLGGEGLHASHLASWRERRPATRIINEYGPTEAAVACCIHDVPVDGAPLPERIPIGRPISNMQLHILDRHQQPVPIGVPGELFIGGVGLARGYLGRPDLTAARFIPNPFEAEFPGALSPRLYRTGDLARYLPDGNIEYLGRLDDQLKIRGHRVEPGEIESALAGHPELVHVAVVARPAPSGELRLVAFVQPEVQEPGEERDLKAELGTFLRGLVPEYMIPSVFVVLEQMPLTPSGKIDRKALPPLAVPASESTAKEVSTELSATERQLQRLFGQLLGLDTVSSEESFFDLGGNSLLAVSLIGLIRDQLGIELPLNEIFEHLTVRSLARFIDEHFATLTSSGPLPDCVVALRQTGRKPPLFFAPPSAGSPAVYVSLARNLSSEQPVFGFQMPGVMNDQAPPVTIEETAALYVEAMRRLQPRGPYRLAGWSFGGLVICEMARQLEAQGEEVALLALIDGAAQDRKTPFEWLRTGSQLVKTLAKTPLPRDYESVRRVGGWLGIGLPESGRELLRKDAEGQRTSLRGVLRDVVRTTRNFTVTMRAEHRYAFNSYGGSAILFRVAQDDPSSDPLVESVRKFARSHMEVIPLPGNHLTVIMDEGNVATLSQRLQECLDKTASVGAV